jgi:hypothetical protein
MSSFYIIQIIQVIARGVSEGIRERFSQHFKLYTVKARTHSVEYGGHERRD